MSIFSGKLALSIAVAALCLGAPTAHAQSAPVRYWIPGWPMGFGSNWATGPGASMYRDFPGFDFSDAGSGLSYTRTNFPSGWFISSERGGAGFSMTGLNHFSAFGNAFSYEGTQVGYNLQNAPVTFYAGFNTSTYRSGAGGPFAGFDITSGTLPVYNARAGVAFQPTPNLNLSLEVGYTQLGPVETEGNSLSLLGMSPSAFGPRR